MTLATIITIAIGAALAVGVFVLVVLRDVVGDLAKQEARAWIPVLSRRIVRQTVEDLPAHQQDLLEDMEAQLNERSDRPITMLLFAIKVARDRRLIIAEARNLALEPVEALSQKRTVSVPEPLAGVLGTFKEVVGAARSRVRRVARVIRHGRLAFHSPRVAQHLNVTKRLLSMFFVLATFIVASSRLISSSAMNAIAVWPANHTAPTLAMAVPLAGVAMIIRHILRRKH